MKLADKVAVITGGARGIGEATAHLFAREGARVVIWDILDEGARVSEAITETGGHCNFQQVRVEAHDQVAAAVDQISSEFGKIDILINNAGITRDRSILKMDDKEWSQVVDVNLTGVFNCVTCIAPLMKSQGYGRIVSAASIVGLKGAFGQSNYAATKAGIIGMTKCWALELAKYGVTANCIAPGYIKTPMTEAIPKAVKRSLIEAIPAQRVGLPEEVALGYLFLASDDAAYINGVCLSIDGGLAR